MNQLLNSIISIAPQLLGGGNFLGLGNGGRINIPTPYPKPVSSCFPDFLFQHNGFSTERRKCRRFAMSGR